MSNTHNISIKRIEFISEAKQVSRIYHKAYGGYISPSDIITYAVEPHHDVYICHYNSTIVGYCATEIRIRHQEIVDIAVDPLYIDKDVDHSLVTFVSTSLPFKTTRSTVKETESYTIRLLASVGFRAISVAKNKYPDGRDGYIMEYNRP